MPKSHRPYAPEFRRQMVDLVRSGRTPEALSREFEPTAQAIWNWKVVDCLSRIEPLEELTEDNKTSLTLKRNGSRVVALPGHDPKTLRGYSAPALIVEDESAFVSD